MYIIYEKHICGFTDVRPKLIKSIEDAEKIIELIGCDNPYMEYEIKEVKELDNFIEYFDKKEIIDFVKEYYNMEMIK